MVTSSAPRGYEFFPTEEIECVDCLIPTWGVEDLETRGRFQATARQPYDDDDGPSYTFPHHCLDDELHRSRLRSLTQGNCTGGALAELVLRDM
jgi:hypothetical protein